MKLFRSSAEDYYDNGMNDAPLPIRALISVVVLFLFCFSKLMWRVKIEGVEHLDSAEGDTGSVIICNHTSMAEVVVIYSHLMVSGHRVRGIAKSEFYHNRFLAWFFSRAGAIPVHRGEADLKAIRSAQHALQRGEDVLIFPEGTRVRTDEQPVEIHGGFALMAQMAKAPVTPMAVCGFRDITPNGKKLMRPKKCWARIGEPVYLANAPEGLKRKERTQWMEDETVRRMYEIRDDLRVEHPGRR